MILLLADATQKAPMHPIGVSMLVLSGAFAVLGACRNWDWFFAWPPAPIFVALLGRTGARIFYMLLGAGIAVLGIFAGAQ
jgi:hypothetical protein